MASKNLEAFSFFFLFSWFFAWFHIQHFKSKLVQTGLKPQTWWFLFHSSNVQSYHISKIIINREETVQPAYSDTLHKASHSYLLQSFRLYLSYSISLPWQPDFMFCCMTRFQITLTSTALMWLRYACMIFWAEVQQNKTHTGYCLKKVYILLVPEWQRNSISKRNIALAVWTLSCTTGTCVLMTSVTYEEVLVCSFSHWVVWFKEVCGFTVSWQHGLCVYECVCVIDVLLTCFCEASHTPVEPVPVKHLLLTQQ